MSEKKKRLALEVSAEQFTALKSMQRLFHLKSAEEVLLFCARSVASAIVSDPEGAMALGAAAIEESNTAPKAAPKKQREQQRPKKTPAQVATNLGDKIRASLPQK